MARYLNPGSVSLITSTRTLEIATTYNGSGICCVWTVPSGVTTATFEIWGGGGSGGVNCCCYCNQGEAGSSGGYSLKTVSVTAGDTYTICAGQGGLMSCTVGAGTSQYGCRGCKSFVTGTGLSNFCVDGGCGGFMVGVCCVKTSVFVNSGKAFGGDININGGKSVSLGNSCSIVETATIGFGAPFGGGFSLSGANHCTPYFTNGQCGIFPGGGGTGSFACCCDCCGCSGLGAPGLVKVTF